MCSAFRVFIDDEEPKLKFWNIGIHSLDTGRSSARSGLWYNDVTVPSFAFFTFPSVYYANENKLLCPKFFFLVPLYFPVLLLNPGAMDVAP